MPKRGQTASTPDPQAWYRLSSFVNMLYEEMDKLAKKAPASSLSDLATQRVNRAIREAKDLMSAHDVYMADLVEFVPAGENPQVRDAVLVLGEISSALRRLDETFKLAIARRSF